MTTILSSTVRKPLVFRGRRLEHTWKQFLLKEGRSSGFKDFHPLQFHWAVEVCAQIFFLCEKKRVLRIRRAGRSRKHLQ